jgi:hypothetical protein
MGKILRGVQMAAMLASLGLLAGPIAAHASLMFGGIATAQGAGVSASNTVLTVQDTPTESGCVAWNGSADVIGSTACPGGLSPAITGGDETTGFSQTQTRTVGLTGVESGESLVVVLNVSEPLGATLFTIGNLSLTVYSPTGTVLFNTGNLFGAPVTLDGSLQTVGTLGFGFLLDPAQAAAISPFICTDASVTGCAGIANPANANNRIGLAALLTDVQGGNEIFFVADAANVSLPVPEPATILIVSTGLALLGLTRRRRKVVSRSLV